MLGVICKVALLFATIFLVGMFWKHFNKLTFSSVKLLRSGTKIECFKLEFKSDVEEKSHVKIKSIRVKFHKEEKKNEEGEKTQQNREEKYSRTKPVEQRRNPTKQRRGNSEHHKPTWNFFQKPIKNKKSTSTKKKKTGLNDEVVDWFGLGLASCCPNWSKIKTTKALNK